MRSPLPSGHPQRVLRLAIGLVLYGAAEALMVQAALGVSPWTVFAQGLARLTGAGLGWVTNVVGLFVLLLWIPLRQRPGAGTVANVLVVGTVIQLVVSVLAPPAALPARVALFTAGLLLLAVASGLYIGARYGPGPRDGLMTGLHARTGRPVWQVRTGVEVSVLAVG
ncbi:membrane protein YczE, partial [Kineococcus indalonis]|uniref:membrane protein YczE n=1 Tax=Kineococcus indalonis TaxID=2696566 RepID=UPI0014120A39